MKYLAVAAGVDHFLIICIPISRAVLNCVLAKPAYLLPPRFFGISVALQSC